MGSDFANTEAAERAGERVGFSFGANWQKYVRQVDDHRVEQAKSSLRHAFAGADFTGRRFIDIGSGSGIFSLAALLLGAEVQSIDFDPNSIDCALELRKRVDSGRWSIDRGSILDRDFVRRIEPGDLVYSWGVLHHTGAMWEALESALTLVKPDGLFLVALYTRPNFLSLHMGIKRAYNVAPRRVRPLFVGLYSLAWLAKIAIKGQNPVTYVREYARNSRGMSFRRDVEDWVGGLPFEFTDEATIQGFVEPRGFEVVRVSAARAGDNNEYLLRRAN